MICHFRCQTTIFFSFSFSLESNYLAAAMVHHQLFVSTDVAAAAPPPPSAEPFQRCCTMCSKGLVGASPSFQVACSSSRAPSMDATRAAHRSARSFIATSVAAASASSSAVVMIEPSGLQNAMTSSEEPTSAEAAGSRPPHRAVTDGLPRRGYEATCQCPRTDSR